MFSDARWRDHLRRVDALLSKQGNRNALSGGEGRIRTSSYWGSSLNHISLWKHYFAGDRTTPSNGGLLNALLSLFNDAGRFEVSIGS